MSLEPNSEPFFNDVPTAQKEPVMAGALQGVVMNDMSFSGTKISRSEPAMPAGALLLPESASDLTGDIKGLSRSRGGRWRVRAFLSNYIFNYIVHSRSELSTQNLSLGFFAAILFVAFNIIRYAYSMSNYLDIAGHAQRIFVHWNTAFIAATAFGFMLKALEESSRGTFVVLYFIGLFALYTGRAAMVHIARSQARNGGILSARIAVVGFEPDVRKFMSLRDPKREAINVVAVLMLPGNDTEFKSALADTIAVARNRMPDEVYIVVPWSRTEVIDKCISAFMELPVPIHLNVDPDSVINRLANAQLGTNGVLSSLSLRSHSMRSAGPLRKPRPACVNIRTDLAFLMASG
jgi:hypothetical protein